MFSELFAMSRKRTFGAYPPPFAHLFGKLAKCAASASHHFAKDFHFRFEFRFAGAQLDAVRGPCHNKRIALAHSKLLKQLFRENRPGRIADRNQFQRLVHTLVITLNLWTDNGAPLGTVQIRAL